MRMICGAVVMAAMMMCASAEAASGAVLWQQNGRDKPQQSAKPKRTDRPQQSAKPKQEDRPQQAAKPKQGAKSKAEQPAQAAKKADRPEHAQKASGGKGRLTRADVRDHVRALPEEIRRLEASPRQRDRIVLDAAARGAARGLGGDRIQLREDGGRVQLLNKRGELLFDMDEDRARRMGAWQTRRIDHDRVSDNAPAFCRSGAGHPVWGREWCLQKGFGLGSSGGMIWSRARVDDVIFRRRSDRASLDRGGLIDVLGDIVLGRLAVHALTLGFDRPLTGTWVAEPGTPRMLRVSSGDVPIAELTDVNNDDRADVLFVTHRQ